MSSLARPGSRRASTRNEELVEATLEVRIPPSLPWGAFFSAHPEITVVATNRFPVGPTEILAEFRFVEPRDEDWSREFRKVPNVVSIQRLHRSGRPDTYRVRWTAPPFYPKLLEAFDIVGMVPFTLRGGRATLTVALSRARLRQMVAAMQRREFEPELLDVRPLRGHETRGDLTAKQRARFRAAVESGYFDVPRRTTLDELAARFSVRKSAFAESLAHARRKVLISAGRLLTGGEDGSLISPL